MNKQELKFIEELGQYENRWVAIVETEEEQRIVGSGGDAVEAARNAEVNGYPEAFLFKVFPYEARYIPLG